MKAAEFCRSLDAGGIRATIALLLPWRDEKVSAFELRDDHFDCSIDRAEVLAKLP